MEHTNSGGSLAVRNGVEDLVDLGRWADGHLDRVAVLQAVKLERAAVVAVHEVRPDVELGQAEVHAQILNPRREALVQPQMCPPFLYFSTTTKNPEINQNIKKKCSFIAIMSYHSHNVAEPLMSELVTDNDGDSLLGGERRVLGVNEKRCLAIGDQTPVLHGTFLS